MAGNTIGFFNRLRTRQNVTLGEGTDVQRIENTVILDYQSFARGLNQAVPASRLPEGFMSYVQNHDIDERDRLVRVPGIVVDETFTGGRAPKYMWVLGNPATGLSELVFIDGAFLGVRGPTGAPTTWTNLSLSTGFEWVSCVHGDLLILTNGVGVVRYKQPLATSFVSLSWGPARALMSFAGRIFAGGVQDGGSYVPLGITWTGATGQPNDLGAGSGFEELLDDTGNGDAIVAMRSLNFDIAAILTKNAVWVARRTGDAFRPADFSPVVGADGALTNASVVRVPGGVAYLSARDVILFDGNTTRSISLPINSMLYPLDLSRIDEYSLNFVESRKVLQVLTPTRMFEYSFVYQRWMMSTVRALRAVNTGTDFETLFGGMVGSGLGAGFIGGWGTVWGRSWGTRTETGGGGGSGTRGLDTTIYLRGSTLGIEQAGATAFFGEEFTSIVDTQLQLAQSLDTVVSIKRIIIEYSGRGGQIQVYLPDYAGGWTLVRTITLPASVEPRSVTYTVRRAGKLAGLRIATLVGEIAIGRVQAEVEMRSQDRTGGTSGGTL